MSTAFHHKLAGGPDSTAAKEIAIISILKHTSATTDEIANKTQTSLASVRNLLSGLRSAEVIKRTGERRNGFPCWTIT